MPVSKLAVSLPQDLFEDIEKARKKQGLSRSSVVQQGLRAWLASIERQKNIKAYVSGYQDHPESDEEVATTVAVISASTRRRKR